MRAPILLLSAAACAFAADPLILQTHLGGNGNDYPVALTFDTAGNLYVAGRTSSTNFAITDGAYQSKNAGGYDAFVAKFDPAGKLVYSTYLGGSYNDGSIPSGLEGATAVAVDGAGAIYLLGYSASPDFPFTAGAYQQDAGSRSIFLLKLDPSGSRLLYAARLGTGISAATALAVNAAGEAYVTGTAFGPEFRTTRGSFQPNFSGGRTDVFLLALTADGSALKCATLLGGAGDDRTAGMAIDGQGNVHLAGVTLSADFPVTADAAQQRYGGSGDAFVSTMDSSCSRLNYSTYLGGPEADSVGGISLDGNGNRYISFNGSIPGIEQSLGLRTVAKIDRDSGRLEWAASSCCDLVVADPRGNAYAAGFGVNNYVSGGAILARGSGTVLKIAPDGTRWAYATAVAGYPSALAARPDGVVAVTGYLDFQTLATTPNAVQPARDLTGRDLRTNVNVAEGFVTLIDTSAIGVRNFLVKIPADPIFIRYRLGDVLPDLPHIDVTGNVVISADFSEPWIGASIDGAGVRLDLRPSILTPGQLSGTLRISSPDVPYPPVALPLSATVQPRPAYTIEGRGALAFEWRETLAAPTSQKLAITAAPFDQSWSFEVKPSAPWLWGNVSPSGGAGRYELFVGVVTAAPGTYSGTLTISMAGVPNSTQVVEVKYTVLPAPVMQLSTTTVQFTWVSGRQPPPAQFVKVTSNVPGIPIGLHQGESWTDLNCAYELSSPVTPADLKITTRPTLSTGIWGCPVDVRIGEQGFTRVFVSVAISRDAPLDIYPQDAIAFRYVRNSALGNPSPPQISVVSNAALTFTVRSDQPWVTGPPLGAAIPTPALLRLVFDTTLKEGVYKANLTFTTTGGYSVKLSVTYDLSDQPRVRFTPATATFTWRVGDAPPPTQKISLTSTSINPAYVEIYPPPNRWAKVEITRPITPTDLTISVDPSQLDPGRYRTEVGIGNAESGLGIIPITLDVTPPAIPPVQLSGILNAASRQPGEIAPGEMVLITGSGMSGTNTRVWFGDVAAPVLSASAANALAVVPYELAGQTRTALVVEANGQRSAPATLSVADASPALFTVDGSGVGPCLSGAAPRGSVVTLFGTGEGALAPLPATGTIAMAPLPSPLLRVSVEIGGVPAEVIYSGPTEGQVYGRLRIDIRVPAELTSGAVPVSLHVGRYDSPPGPTLTIE